MTWKKVSFHIGDYPVSVYVNETDTRAVVFPLFGRFYGVWSDTSAIDLVTTLLFLNPSRTITYTQYVNSQEDTAIIYQESA